MDGFLLFAEIRVFDVNDYYYIHWSVLEFLLAWVNSFYLIIVDLYRTL